MSTSALKRYSVAEYLALERESSKKHEFFEGEIFAMAGGNDVHSLLAMNVSGELRERLKNGPCRVYTSNMRIACPSGLRTYPDVTVACGHPEFEDQRRDTLLNPQVIIEVLSPSTEKYDRGRKWANYQGIPSLREYVLILQDCMRVEHYSREGEANVWVLKTSTLPHESVRFPAIGCEVPMSEVSAKIELPAETLGLHDDPEVLPA